jgi:hypothetical protein
MRVLTERNSDLNRYRFVVIGIIEDQEVRIAESDWRFAAKGQAANSGRAWVSSLTDKAIGIFYGNSRKQAANL